MARVWRVSAHTELDGAGGLFVEGRWYSVGQRAISTAEHPALALLESMAHMHLLLSAIPTTLKLLAVDIAEGASFSPQPALPSGWQANEATSRAVGDQWLHRCAALALPVPSAIVPHAVNYVLNPLHPQATTHLRIASVEPIWIDPRFLH